MRDVEDGLEGGKRFFSLNIFMAGTSAFWCAILAGGTGGYVGSKLFEKAGGYIGEIL